MATEKSWQCRQNISVSEADEATTGGNWMYEFYNFLSGGAGNATAAWEVLSASNGVTTGDSTLLADAGDFIWGTGDRSWFTMRKSILPVTGGITRYIWLTVDLVYADTTDAYWIFDYQEPNFGSIAKNSRPAETSNAYEKKSQYRLAYDAGNATYFHGTIDLTGSFVTVTSQNNISYPNYHGSIGCFRIETPRSSSVDPFPAMVRVAWDDSNARQGAWSYGEGGATLGNSNTVSDAGYGLKNGWGDYGGQGLWTAAGVMENANGNYASFLSYGGAYSTANSVFCDFNIGGSQLDGTWPLLAGYIAELRNNSTSIIRGRIPDVHPGGCAGNDGYSGMTLPATGTPTHCAVGSWWLPFTASLLPGENY